MASVASLPVMSITTLPVGRAFNTTENESAGPPSSTVVESFDSATVKPGTSLSRLVTVTVRAATES